MPPSRRLRLMAEFAALFWLAPVAVAMLLPPSAMFAALMAFTGVGLVLLHLTPGFRWSELLAGRGVSAWRPVAALATITLVASLAIVAATRPQALFFLPLNMPALWLLIVALYPLLSALPQELVFRPLFFRRYGALLPPGRAALVINAAAFSVAHLLFWSGIVLVMTFVGGLVFAWAYRERGSFALAVLLHAVAGVVLFTVGMGQFFYTGNVSRPF